MGKLRLRDWKDVASSAGVYALLSIIVGSLILFSSVYFAERIQQPGGLACTITSKSVFERVISNGSKAVMFSSDNCPVCRRMEPYWKQLCEREPGRYYILKLNEETYDLFISYGVLETPTFIIFRNGTPVARHVGAFEVPHGQSVASAMEAWVNANIKGSSPQEALALLNKYCSSCHTVPKGTSREDIESWISANPSDPFAKRFAQAYSQGITLSQLYNGTSGLVGMILSMNNTIPLEDAEKIALFLDNLATNRSGEGTRLTAPKTQEENKEGQTGETGLAAMSAAAALTAGLIAAFSPCVFPLLLSYTAMLQASGKEHGLGAAVRSGLAAAAGVGLIGVLFVLLGSTAQKINSVLVPAAASVLLGAGVLGALDIPTFVNIGVRTRRGLTSFSFLYGILAVQCSFPLVAGTLMLLTAGGSLKGVGLIVLLAFILGVSAPVSLAVAASGRASLRRLLAKASTKKALRYANAVLAVMGLVMLAYSLGLI
ncbi:MAG: thioredoxin domain-containing protein [Desulfurococcales archaeon]|nr:thioredoxin domain-containing protein [Desulfurococcales archaeon]